MLHLIPAYRHKLKTAKPVKHAELDWRGHWEVKALPRQHKLEHIQGQQSQHTRLHRQIHILHQCMWGELHTIQILFYHTSTTSHGSLVSLGLSTVPKSKTRVLYRGQEKATLRNEGSQTAVQRQARATACLSGKDWKKCPTRNLKLQTLTPHCRIN